MNQPIPLIAAAAALLVGCAPPPAPTTPTPPVPHAAPDAATAASLRLDVRLTEAPDGTLLATGTVVNTGASAVRVGRELRLSFQFEPNEIGAPRFGGNPFDPAGQPGFVLLAPAAAAAATTAAEVREEIALAKPADRDAVADGRLRVTAQVSVLPVGADPRRAAPQEVPLTAVVELRRSGGGNSVFTSVDVGRVAP